MERLLEISFTKSELNVTVYLKGEIDIKSSPKFTDRLTEAIKEDYKIILDCEYLDYIDSTGLGALVAILKKVKLKGGWIRLINMKSTIRKLFSITGLDNVFIID